MKSSRILLIVALVLFIVLTYFASSGYEGAEICKPREVCEGDQYWNCDQCTTKVNDFVNEGQACSLGVHCKEKNWCMVGDTVADTNPPYQKLWETTLNGKTGMCTKFEKKPEKVYSA